MVKQRLSIWQRFRKSTVQTQINIICTIVIAVATCVYSRFAGIQLREIKIGNALTEESIESVQRAFLVFTGIHPNLQAQTINSKTEESIAITDSWENEGQTPATDAFNYFRLTQQQGEPTESQFAEEQTGFSPAYIGPKMPISGATIVVPVSYFPFIPGSKGTREFPNTFFWGWVTYKDAFPNTPVHLTEFCQVVLTTGTYMTKIPSQIKMTPDIGMTFGNCQKHNCVDKDCEDYDALIKLGRS